MTVNYAISSEVVDIRYDNPKAGDAFLVDTNVWYWVTYSRASMSRMPPLNYQITTYPNYMQASLQAGARILQSGLSLSELTHLIEKSEWEIYRRISNTSLFKKEYRHNLDTERANVVSEVHSAWGQVLGLAEPLDVLIDAPASSSALTRLRTQQVDGYDLFMLEAMNTNGIIQVLTDDGDFATVPGIQVFTANQTVIDAACAQGKLIVR